MNLSDITKINFGSAGISAVYNGGIKLWPKQVVTDNKVMKFTTTDGNTWNHTGISAYTADNRLIQPVKKDATGWTYDEEVGYITGSNYRWDKGTNLLTFEGFPKAVKLKSGYYLFADNSKCTDISITNMDMSECTNMGIMFDSCGSLTSLDVSKFNTSQVKNMGSMFAGCSKLASLDLSNWDTSNVTSTYYMFNYCSALQTVKMTNCSQDTKDKIRAALDAAGLTSAVITD